MTYNMTIPETERARCRRYRRNAEKVLMLVFKGVLIVLLLTGMFRLGAEAGRAQALKQCQGAARGLT